MRRVLVVFTTMLVSLGTGTAAAGPGATDAKTSATIIRKASAPELARETEALALIAFPWQQLQYAIVFRPPQPGLRAVILVNEHRIEIYARPGDDSLTLAYDIAHELGHAIDLTLNTSQTRRKWMELRGIDPATPWFGCNLCSDYKTPAGDFAETFALLLLGPGRFLGRMSPPPSSAEQISRLTPYFPSVTFATSRKSVR